MGDWKKNRIAHAALLSWYMNFGEAKMKYFDDFFRSKI